MIQIVVTGNAFEGMKAFGPFFDEEQVSDFTDSCRNGDWMVVDLVAPCSSANGDDLPVGLWVFEDEQSDLTSVGTLVTLWPNGDVEMATREQPQHSWSPPVLMENRETR